MKKVIKAAVLAGTPVDTMMGVTYLQKKNDEPDSEGILIEPLYRPVAESCDAQVRFQYSDQGGKREVLDNIFDSEIEQGVQDFFIYCNSLSGSFSFDTYALEKSLESDMDIRIYTPLQVYRRLGAGYSRIGVMAANNLSAHAIEEALMTANPDIYVIGTGNMAIVRAIEDGCTPEEIVKICRLKEMASYMEACGAEAIIIGCTHFPYFMDELAKVTKLPLVDPAEEMYKALVNADI